MAGETTTAADAKVIEPTVGRVVHYYDSPPSAHRGPRLAMICYVWNSRMVNLTTCDPNGNWSGRTSVTLVQPGEEKPTQGAYCEWMPYQKAKPDPVNSESAEPRPVS
jgi:hypothetical protein